MSLALGVLVAVILASSIAAVIVGIGQRLAWRRVTGRRCVVNLVSGRSFGALLWQQRGPLLVLRDVAVIDNGRSTPLDGELVIERTQVEFVQVLR